jgi:carbon storage regulator
MLVLSRKKNESILIGDDIKITLADIRGDKCKIGIEAPRDVNIRRNEVEPESPGIDYKPPCRAVNDKREAD